MVLGAGAADALGPRRDLNAAEIAIAKIAGLIHWVHPNYPARAGFPLIMRDQIDGGVWTAGSAEFGHTVDGSGMGGKPVFQGAGVGRQGISRAITLSSSYSVLMALQQDVSQLEIVAATEPEVGGEVLLRTFGSNRMSGRNNTTSLTSADGSFPSDIPVVVGWTFDGVTNTAKWWINEDATATATASGVIDPAPAGLVTWWFGSAFGSTSPYEGQMGHCMIFDRDMSQAANLPDWQTVIGYVAAYHGATLA
jgi:hypothetical protein